jgi:hypothetical protein
MLNGEGCQELGRLHDLATSHGAAVLEDVPKDVHKLAGWIVRRCGNHMACLRVFASLRQPMR